MTNFDFLTTHDPLFLQLAQAAECAFNPDPNTTLVKLRQLGEAFAKDIASRIGITFDENTKQVDLLRGIDDAVSLDRTVRDLFHTLRKLGNAAAHEYVSSHHEALQALQIAFKLAAWFHCTIGGESAKGFTPPAFQKPEDPAEKLRQLELEVQRLRSEQSLAKAQIELNQQLLLAEQLRARELETYAANQAEERQVWETLAIEQEQALQQVTAKFESKLADNFAYSTQTLSSDSDKLTFMRALAQPSIDLNEAETRIIIDQQLREAGWEVDSENLKFSKGTRPQKGKFRAIAEWPTDNGPADYVLFYGTTALAVVEAKKKSVDVAGAIDQAKRYGRAFKTAGTCELPGGPWGEFLVPFVFSANGKRFLQQLRTQTGVWFCDLRRPQNLRRPMDGWYSPEGLNELLKQNIDTAEAKLDTLTFEFDFKLRDYQVKAIERAEEAIRDGKTLGLLAMATGTGKTKTCIALVYRLLRAQRFRRILFLVDRTALGEQAANVFKDTRMENLQTFADIFGIKELDDKTPDSDTKVHIATIQGLVKRLFYNDNDQDSLTVDQYDCIVIDECHRGYLLDRELSDTEITFRDQNDYISKYRRVLDYFDAVKIGLTATPALHTTEIFGEPIYTYSYREAVIDGYLIDHEPPFQIKTELSQNGITWAKGAEIQVYDLRDNTLDLVHAPDEITLEVEQFNKKVITEPFNQVVCEALAQHIDPSLPGKTLIFCATDKHADMVVALLKDAFQKMYGEIEDDAVTKITGAADKPLQLIRRFKNERLPNVAVTVDLLTTGIDVPEICNIVFLRRVNSRILYEQMLGRATRRCDYINKEVFHIFDAVDLYAGLAPLTSMKPVVVNPNITYTQLVQEITQHKDEDIRTQARDQIIAKLQRKKRHMNDRALSDFETYTGMTPDAFIKKLKDESLDEIAGWFINKPDLGEILEQDFSTHNPIMFVSDHKDALVGVERGYGSTQKPEDYLESFRQFIYENSNRIPALLTVLQRPRELTRRELKTLLMELDQKGFTEKNLETAWHQMTNQDIAARIIGFIRQAALGDALISWEQRVDQGVAKILQKHNCTPVQKQWLTRIAAQMKRETIVDREALDSGVFKVEGGGFKRIDKIFNGQLVTILGELNDALWAMQA
jgi:type I restriction enzyme, R subunit